MRQASQAKGPSRAESPTNGACVRARRPYLSFAQFASFSTPGDGHRILLAAHDPPGRGRHESPAEKQRRVRLAVAEHQRRSTQSSLKAGSGARSFVRQPAATRYRELEARASGASAISILAPHSSTINVSRSGSVHTTGPEAAWKRDRPASTPTSLPRCASRRRPRDRAPMYLGGRWTRTRRDVSPGSSS